MAVLGAEVKAIVTLGLISNVPVKVADEHPPKVVTE